MAQVPNELLSEVFSLACAEHTHDIEQKLHLAQVCAYWRAVALGYPSFWAQIRVETSRDAAWLPMALARAGDSALDVELCWQHNRYSGSTFSDAEEQAVVDALIAPEQRLRLKRLFVRPAAPILLSALLGAGSKFPALEDLEFEEDFQYLAHVADRLDAPSLRRLNLSGLCLKSYDFLDTPSLEHLSVRHAFDDEKDRLLTTILYRCTALRCLDWGVPQISFMPTIIDETQRPLASRLNTLRLGDTVPVPFSDILRFINRAAVDPLSNIAVTIGGGEAKSAPLVDLFSRMGALVDLHYDDTDEEVVIRDDVGRIRRLVSSDSKYPWGMNDLWCILARLYAIDQSLRSLRVRTNDWHGLAGGFATRAPTALTEVYIVLRGRMQGTSIDLAREGNYDIRGMAFPPPTRVLNLPSLRRLVIVKDCRSAVYEARWEDYDPCRDPTIPHLRAILQHIECEASSRVEVCVSVPELFEGRTLPRATQETLLDGLDDKWVLCSHCTGT